jgi:hypothetical protein
MADDLEDTLPVNLPVLALSASDKEVKRGEVFCSKIIHQRSTHQSRFTWSTLYKKIVAHNNPECSDADDSGHYPRPLSSPFPCFACHRPFTGPPIFIPMMALNGNRTEWGNFCSPPCANTYLHSNMNDSNLAARVADFHEYCQDVHGYTGETIGFAPHFTMLQTYGGCMTDDQFNLVSKTAGLRTHERMAPFIPTNVVIEWQCKTSEKAAAAAAMPQPVQETAAEPVHISTLFTRQATLSTPQTDASKTATETLAKVMGSKPEAAHHHHQWGVTSLRQPPLAEIEKRLSELPPVEQKEGLYEIYYNRQKEKGVSSTAAATAVPLHVDTEKKQPPRKKVATTASTTKRASAKAASEALAALERNHTGLGAMLVSAKEPSLRKQ